MVAKPVHRILLVDDHPIVRVGVKERLESTTDLRVVGEAASADEAIALADALKPDLVLLDISLPDASGVQVCRQIVASRPQTRILMMSIYDDADLVRGAIAAGAHGYMLKGASVDMLLEAVRLVAAGSSFLHPQLIGMVLTEVRESMRGKPREQLRKLSRQEQRILPLVAEGKTNKEIGSELILSDKTVKNYLANMFDKLNVTRRSQAAALYARSLRACLVGAAGSVR